MEPKINKPGAYKSPGIYNGEGGIYKGRGVYNDGAEEFVEIGGKKYYVVNIGSLKWISENLDFSDPNIIETTSNTNTYPAMYHNINELYGAYYNEKSCEYLTLNESVLFGNGWRVARQSDYQHILNLGFSIMDFVSESNGGTNKSGFNARYSGFYENGWSGIGNFFLAWWGTTSEDARGVLYIDNIEISLYNGYNLQVKRSIRLCKDA